MPESMDELCKQYENQLTEQEKKALEIARRCLESSFDMSKTLGFQKWVNNLNSNKN
jgi:hypothetical protein|tara:strand:+ start:274 stop:441 length:168 start_codon:yes stop_codon:yes gene_type:complete